MKCKLYLPYIDFDTDAFYADQSFYSKGNSYEDALRNYSSVEGGVMGAKTNRTDFSYASCECECMNLSGIGETVDSMVAHAVNNDTVVLIFAFDFDNMEEEFECELKSWVKQHNKVKSKLTDLSIEEECQQAEPFKEMRISFKNLKDEDIYLEMEGCRLLEPVGEDGYAIVVNKITFLK